MNAVEEILAGIDIDQLAAQLGTEPDAARAAAEAAIPALFGSLTSNAADSDGASSLLAALGQHAESAAYGPTVDLSSIDTADGQKILAHMFADQPERLQPLGGLSGSLLSKLLPLLAPIVMSYIAKKLGMGAATGRSSGGDILSDLLGGLLGGNAGGLGDILGDILGGGSRTPQPAPSGGGGLGDILGGGQQQPTQQPAPSTGTDSPFRPGGSRSGRLQIPMDETPEPQQRQSPEQTGGGSGGLGDLLDQILGRRR